MYNKIQDFKGLSSKEERWSDARESEQYYTRKSKNCITKERANVFHVAL